MGVSPIEVGRLTRQEIRILLEGERVDAEIETLVERIREEGGVDEALGTVVPRESDLEVLEEFEAKHGGGAGAGPDGTPRRN